MQVWQMATIQPCSLETLVTTNHVTVAGEVKNFNVDNVEEIVPNKVKEIGYEQDGFLLGEVRVCK